MAYTYWCKEKGYSNHDGDPRQVRNWIKTMQTDVWITVFLVTIGTIPFFLLGASILNSQGLYPPPNGDIIQTLLVMFTSILGEWARWFFIPLTFFVLFSTFLSGTAAFTRTITDYFISMGLIIERENTRQDLVTSYSIFNPSIFLHSILHSSQSSFIIDDRRYLGGSRITYCEYWCTISCK